MPENIELEGWARGVLNKRGPDAVRILMDLLQAGLRNGRATANDVGNYSLAEPNVIGGVFKLLPYCGFVCDRNQPPIQTEERRKHKRWIPVWTLVDTRKAVAVMDQFRAVMLGVTDTKQGVLL